MATRPRRHTFRPTPSSGAGRILTEQETLPTTLLLASPAWIADTCPNMAVSGRESVRAGDDLEDLLRDLRLSGPVHCKSQVVDQLAGILGRVPHRRHLRAVLGGGR